MIFIMTYYYDIIAFLFLTGKPACISSTLYGFLYEKRVTLAVNIDFVFSEIISPSMFDFQFLLWTFDFSFKKIAFLPIIKVKYWNTM